MKVHELKIRPEFYGDVVECLKTFELRQDDRGYEVGDVLILQEYDNGKFTGRRIAKTIKYILRGPCYGLKDGWCILAI